MTIVAAPKKVITIIVMAAFIMVCVLAPFGAAHAIVGLSTAAVTILIAGLAAIGITFASTGEFDTLNEYVESLLQDYATDNNIPVTSIFNGTQYSSSAAGKLLLNNRFVTLIDTFAKWIVGKYSLTSNNNVTVQQSGTTLNGIPVFPLPYAVYTYASPNNYTLNYIQATGDEEVYLCAVYSANKSNIFIYLISESTFTAQKTVYQNGVYNRTVDYSPTGHNTNWYYVSKDTIEPQYFVSLSESDFIVNSDFWHALSENPVIDTNNIGVGIGVGSIDYPTDNTNYNAGDGAILDVGASWGETTGGAIATVPDIWPQWLPQTETLTANPDISIEYEAEAILEDALPRPSDIENLPGATIPGLPDIDGNPWHLEFSNLWHYVAQWISDMSAGGAVLWNVCIQAPPAIVNLVFAGIVLAMWFGAIKILR